MASPRDVDPFGFLTSTWEKLGTDKRAPRLKTATVAFGWRFHFPWKGEGSMESVFSVYIHTF